MSISYKAYTFLHLNCTCGEELTVCQARFGPGVQVGPVEVETIWKASTQHSEQEDP